MQKITVTVLDGQGMPKEVTVEVADNATPKDVMEAVKEKMRNE